MRIPPRMRLRKSGRDPLLANEALVVAHHQLRLDLLHRVKHNTHDNQQTRAADNQRLVPGQDAGAAKESVHKDAHQKRQHSHKTEEERTHQRDSTQHFVQVLLGARARDEYPE